MSPEPYNGPVVFVDGIHYPLGKDGEPDLAKPLRWTPDGYRRAKDDEPLHNDVHQDSEAAIEPGGEG